MDLAYVSALSALAGSTVGGLTTGFTTWLSLRSQARIARQVAELQRRQDLFRDFISATSTAYADAMVSTEPKIPDVVALWAMVSRMGILCTPATAACAERIMHQIMEIFFAPPKSTAELHDLMRNGTGIDPLKEFSELARKELNGVVF